MFEDIMKKGIQLVQKLNKEYPSIIYWAITPSKLFESVKDRVNIRRQSVAGQRNSKSGWVAKGEEETVAISKYFSARVTVPKSKPKCQRKISADCRLS